MSFAEFMALWAALALFAAVIDCWRMAEGAIFWPTVILTPAAGLAGWALAGIAT